MKSQAVVGSLALVLIASLIIWLNEAYVAQQWHSFKTIRPYIALQIKPYLLSAAAEQALKPGDSFRECAKDCPEMVVIPAGQFLMGSPDTESGRFPDEGPQHQVTITQSFAMAKHLVTFDDWNACVSYGNCPPTSDLGWGQGQQPVIFVSWNDAQLYVAWLSKMTGKPYRLPSEAEWEFAVRAGSATPYSLGDDPISLGDYGWYNANSGGRSHPVGLKKPNAFGLYDMHGNAWEWVEDCFHTNYVGAPADGSAWITPNCIFRTARGGTWSAAASALRSANRFNGAPVYRVSIVGFRVARQLSISDH
jgi:formylglycine-generating enzyme required for sulfatase activity